MDTASGGTHHLYHDDMKNKKNSTTRRKREKVKVVYISSPMKVKTSASKFRALVQELTGRHSDVSRFMELNGAFATDSQTNNLDHRGLIRSFDDHDHVSLAPVRDPRRESPTSSDSFLEPLDDGFSSHMEHQFTGLFSSNLFYESPQVDVLGSYDSL
uniref:VQ domain-containing protein n=1 Tax=Davidia involucrata TaxID=16924 RepID=A0A5B6YQP6_DAVIN